MSEDTWYYAREGERHGPVTEAALRDLAARGLLHPPDLVWRPGMAAWAPAAQVADLFPPGTVPPPLPMAYTNPRWDRPPPVGESAAMRMILPVGRSGWAIAAGYLGLFSVLMLPAPLALICGLLAIGEMRRHPERHGMGRAIFGLIMGSLGSIGLVLFLIAALART